MEKINIAEILKDCPKGMELDCTMYDNMYFDEIVEDEMSPFSISCYTIYDGYRTSLIFTEYGEFNKHMNAKCVIFPKGKTNWEGFNRPFKDGDILYIDCSDKESDGDVYKYIFILKKIDSLGNYFSYCHCAIDGFCSTTQYLADNKYKARFATEEEKEKLFKAIKDNGYKWNYETKTLEELPKFKDGDIIYNRFQDTIGILMHNKSDFPCKICDVSKNGTFWYNEGSFIPIVQRDYRLATEKEKEKLFQAIKDNGLRWNSKTKTMEVLIVPKFKVGDRIQGYGTHINHPIRVVKSLEWDRYRLDNGNYIKFGDEHAYKLLKFDITTLKSFESKVLVRDGLSHKWLPAIWGFYNEDDCDYHYEVVGGTAFCYCIPYEGNEHLCGTINDCSEFYKTWE